MDDRPFSPRITKTHQYLQRKTATWVNGACSSSLKGRIAAQYYQGRASHTSPIRDLSNQLLP